MVHERLLGFDYFNIKLREKLTQCSWSTWTKIYVSFNLIKAEYVTGTLELRTARKEEEHSSRLSWGLPFSLMQDQFISEDVQLKITPMFQKLASCRKTSEVIIYPNQMEFQAFKRYFFMHLKGVSSIWA